MRLRASDGSWVWVEGQATLRFRAGSAIAVEIIGRDVTRTRAAEDEGRRLASQLKALVAGAPYGILMLDKTGRIAVINEQACSLLELGRRARTSSSAATSGADLPQPRAPARRARGRDRQAARGRRRSARPCASSTSSARDGRRVSFDHVPLGDDGAAGPPVDVPRHHPVQARRARSSASSWRR